MRGAERAGRRWAKVRWARWRWMPWVVIFVVMAIGLRSAEDASNDAHQALVELEADRRVDAARACVNAWEGRLGVRSLMEAMVAAATQADPAVVKAFRADMARRLPDPDCDLAAAERIAPP